MKVSILLFLFLIVDVHKGLSDVIVNLANQRVVGTVLKLEADQYHLKTTSNKLVKIKKEEVTEISFTTINSKPHQFVDSSDRTLSGKAVEVKDGVFQIIATNGTLHRVNQNRIKSVVFVQEPVSKKPPSSTPSNEIEDLSFSTDQVIKNLESFSPDLRTAFYSMEENG